MEERVTRDWIIRYAPATDQSKQHIFAGYKDNGNIKYAFKYENMARYQSSDEAMRAALELLKHGDYIVDVRKIHPVGDPITHYYLSGGA